MAGGDSAIIFCGDCQYVSFKEKCDTGRYILYIKTLVFKPGCTIFWTLKTHPKVCYIINLIVRFLVELIIADIFSGITNYCCVIISE